MRWVESGQPWTVRAPSVALALTVSITSGRRSPMLPAVERTVSMVSARPDRASATASRASVRRGAPRSWCSGSSWDAPSCDSSGVEPPATSIGGERLQAVRTGDRWACTGLAGDRPAGTSGDGRAVLGSLGVLGANVRAVHLVLAAVRALPRVGSPAVRRRARCAARDARARRRARSPACSRRRGRCRRPPCGGRAGRRGSGRRRRGPAARAPGSPSGGPGCRRARSPSAAGRTTAPRSRSAAPKVERRNSQSPMTAVSVSIWPSAIVRLRLPDHAHASPGAAGAGRARDRTSMPRAWKRLGRLVDRLGDRREACDDDARRGAEPVHGARAARRTPSRLRTCGPAAR